MKLSSAVLRIIATLSFAAPTAAENLGFAGQIYNAADFKDFDSMSVEERIMAVSKLQWPECMTGPLNNAIACKAHIESELAAMDLTVPIDVVIIYSRRPDSPTSNAIVIPIDEHGMCSGKHGDGRLFYDFDWCISEKVVMTDSVKIENSRKLLKPTKWTKMIAANKNVVCEDVDADGELEVWHTQAEKVMGGDFEVACSSTVGIQKIENAKTAGAVIDVGCNKIPAIDCSGMSGVDACMMIKKYLVPYPNSEGKNMECWLSYKKNSPKLLQIQQDLETLPVPPETKVRIYAMWNSKKVYDIPTMHGPRAEYGSQ